MKAPKKAQFQPPAHLVEKAREAGLLPQVKEPIMLYGGMVTDAQIVIAELNDLAFAGHDYASKLRVIRGAAKRICDSVDKLCGA